MSPVDWKTLLTNAHERRQALIEGADFDSWRVFHGYEEGCKGVTIEKFGQFAVIDYKPDIRNELVEIAEVLQSLYRVDLVIAKGHQSLQLKLKQRLFAVVGELSSEPAWANEFGVRYNLKRDAVHNCGLYLDARPVRAWLQKNCAGRQVLNLFAFAGSLGVAAAKGGAKQVTHLDKSAELLPRIKSSYEANGLCFDDRNFLRGDIYKHLPRAYKYGKRFDGIILDPPPKVYASHYAKNKPRGQDFAQLVKLCSRLLNPGGWLLAMFHRFDSTWEQDEKEIIAASDGALVPSERMTSDADFPESNPENKLRITVFVNTQ